MSPREDEQRTIEDYRTKEGLGTDQHRNGADGADTPSNSKDDEAGSDWPATTIGFDSPTELLENLEEKEHPLKNSSEIISQLARYLDRTHPSSSKETQLQAREALEAILETADPPIDSPDLFRLLDDGFVERELVLEHTLALVPVPLEEIPEDIRIDADKIEELSFDVRLDCYEVLAHGPPDPSVFEILSNAASTYDSEIPLPGDNRNPDQWKREHARRIALAYVSDRHEGIDEGLAARAVRVAWSEVLPELADNIQEIVDTSACETLVEGLEAGRGIGQLSNTTFADNLIEAFIERREDSHIEAYASLAALALEQGCEPDTPSRLWGRLEEAIFADHDPDQCRDIMIAMLTPALARDIDAEVYTEQVLAAHSEDLVQSENNRTITERRARAILATLNKALEVADQGILSERSAKRLADLLQLTSGETRILATDCLAQTDRDGTSGKLLTQCGALGSIIGAISQVETATELEQYGRVLEAAGVYPVPSSIYDLYDSTDSEIEAEAKRIARTLRQQFRERPPACHPDGIEGGVNELAEQLSVKYRGEDGVWRPLDLAPTDREFLTLAGLACKDGESKQVVLPYQDPTAFELSLLAAVLVILGEDDSSPSRETEEERYQGVGNEPEVAIYSPGTSARWGTIDDIKSRLTWLGIGDSTGAAASSTPLKDLVPRGRVDPDTGTTIPDDESTTVADNPPILPVVRSLDELAVLEPEVVIYNLIPSVSRTEQNVLEDIRRTTADGDTDSVEDATGDDNNEVISGDERPSAAMLEATNGEDPPAVPQHTALEVYGLFTAQETDSWHTGTGPPAELTDPVIPGGEELEGSSPESETLDGGAETVSEQGRPDQNNWTRTVPAVSGQRAARAARLINTTSQVMIHRVQTGNDVTGALERLYDAATSLDSQSATSREPRTVILRFQRDIERLPVPTAYHDEWVREQRAAGQFGVPASLVERANAIDNLGSEHLGVSETVHEASAAAHAARDSVADENPLFKALLRLLDDARDEGQHVGILCPKKSLKDMLYAYLREHAAISDSELDQLVTMLDHDMIRTLGAADICIDRLIRFGVGERQTAPYYSHPGVGQVDIIAYDGTRPTLRVEQVFDAAMPLFPPTTGITISHPSIREQEIRLDEAAGDSPADTPFIEPDRSFEESLFLAYLTDDKGSRSGATSGNAPELYRFEFEDGESQKIVDSRPVIVRNRQQLVSQGDYTLQRVPAISPGDSVVILEARTRNDLWQQYLEPRYEEEDMDTVVQAIRLWYEAIETAITTVDPEDGRATDATAIYRELENEIPESKAAVRRWVSSVKEAEDPRDLLFRRELTMGPEVEVAVGAVAERYGSEGFREDSGDVFRMMESVRDTHANYGHEFWEYLSEMACNGSLFDRPGIAEQTVASIDKV